MSTTETVLASFANREKLHEACGRLLTSGFNQAQISIVTTGASLEELKAQPALRNDERTEVLDEADTGNVQGMVGGIPAYLAAVLAAGVTVASGGALGGIALAALGAGAAGGLVGAGAARLLKANIDQSYDEQLAQGGIILVVSPFSTEQRNQAEHLLRENGALQVTVTPFEDTPSETETGRLISDRGPAVDSAAWTG